jgi:glycosidase
LYEQLCPAPLTPTIVFGNHDNRRSINRIKNNLQKARLLALFQLTARGVPVVYYGEEIGMRDVWMPKKDAKDPISAMMKAVPQFMRKKLPVPLNRDVCRTPMQWDTTANAGFSKTTPWLPVGSEADIRNVQTQGADTLSLLNTYKRLLHYRKQSNPIKNGEIIWHNFGHNKSVLSFMRHNISDDADSSDFIDVYINFSPRTKKIKLSDKILQNLEFRLNPGDRIEGEMLILSPYGGAILKDVGFKILPDSY